MTRSRRPSRKTGSPSRRGSLARVLWVVGLGMLVWAGAWWWPRRHPPAPPSTSSVPAAPGGVEPQAAAFAGYAGSTTCRECHDIAHAAWVQSHHRLAERPLDPGLDRAAFDPPHRFTHGSQHSEAYLSNSVPHLTTLGPQGRPEAFPIQRVIGHDPLRQFLVEQPGGRLQTLEAAYDPKRSEWFNVYGNEDRQPGEWGHWTGRGMTWNTMCASCHNTRLRKNYDETTDTFRTAQAEPSVGCEACHGPLKQHVELYRQAAATGYRPPRPPTLSRAQVLDTCGSCHARRYELTGDFKPGDAFFDHFTLTVPDTTDLYYPDGQVREENYEFASFLSSRMHAAGVTCTDCHHPHLAKTNLRGNLLCLRCHTGGYTNSPIINPAAHTFHKPDSPGSQCVNCHMPQTTYMQRHSRHDHGFTIPDPLLSQEFAVPNACNRCHSDKDISWALEAVNRWYGPRMNRPSRHRAQTVARARRGDPAARDPLLSLLTGSETPFWKAVAANLLDLWAAEPDVQRALLNALSHTHPLVRFNAAQSLGPLAGHHRFPAVDQALTTLLNDPVRSVRYQAAWTLRATVDPHSVAGRDLIWALDLNADFPSGQMQKGAMALARQNLPQALAHYTRAATWDPNSAPLRHDLAVVCSQAGQHQEALQQLQHACRLAPRDAEYRFKLGLAFHELGQLEQAIQALQETVQLDPRHGRAAYNLGLALHRAGRPEAALQALAQAQATNPNDPNLPYARATILLQLGRYEDAKTAAAEALAIQPDYAAAREILQSLP